MADFCTECSLELFEKDYGELAGLSTEEDTRNLLYAVVICEGCGFVQVDHTGKCIGGTDCMKGHRYEQPAPAPAT